MNRPIFSAGIRAVFFDAVGTLLHIQPPAVEVYANLGERSGYSFSSETIAKRFRAAFQLEDTLDGEQNWATSEERELHRWQRIVANVFPNSCDDLFQQLWQHFASPEAWIVPVGVGEMLTEFAQRGITLGLASNFDQRLHSVAASFPDLAPLKLRLISSEIGWRKPSPRFFDALVAAAGCTPEQILHVGDDRVNDYDGARTAGLRAVLINTHKQIVNWKEWFETV
jgi:putative hydrolase of the HAD superfamily